MRRIYPKDVFPGAWDLLDQLSDDGVLLSSEEVFEELKVQDDEVLEWAKKNFSIFVPLDEHVQTSASKILTTHSNLVDLKRRKSGADPFVVGTAIVKGCAVVTEEKPSGGPRVSKIPDVCKAYQIKCITVLEMLRESDLKLG